MIGDDDTMFSPLALAQYLGNLDPRDEHYLGTRSESIEQRKAIGWEREAGGLLGVRVAQRRGGRG